MKSTTTALFIKTLIWTLLLLSNWSFSEIKIGPSVRQFSALSQAIASDTLPVVTFNSDEINDSLVIEDTLLVAPIIQFPKDLKDSMQSVLKRFLHSKGADKGQFAKAFDSPFLLYQPLSLDQNGKVTWIGLRRDPTAEDRVFRECFRRLYLSMRCTPLLRKTNPIRYLNSDLLVLARFSSCRLKYLRVIELKSKKVIYLFKLG